MVTIEITPIELFIESRIVFVAFCLGETMTPLDIACTMNTEVEFSPKWNFVALVSTTSVFVISTILIGIV